MSRRKTEVAEFGSDSFLDIVANIVGILIILIVIAGVRVSRAPLVSIQPEEQHVEEAPSFVQLLPADPDEDESPIHAPLFEEDPLPLPSPRQATVEKFVPPPETPLPAIPALETPTDLVAKFNSLKQESELLQKQSTSEETDSSSLRAEIQEGQQRLVTVMTDVSALNQKLDQLEQQTLAIESENRQSQKLVDVLAQRLQQTSTQELKTEKLAHRLNPVGRVVSGREVHFRLLNNEVAYVPVEALVLLVKRDMQRRRDFLLKQPRFQSTVGPVNGFEMEYLVQRESSSLLNDVGLGSGMVRVSVTDWVIHGGNDVVSEPLEKALRPGSQFHTALVSEGTNATITFWTYPDSFKLHEKLKKHVHDAGFWVASRPLPIDFPIAGSANKGTKSVAQ